MFQNITNKFDFNKLHVSSDIVKVLQDSTGGLLNSVTNVIRNFLVNLLEFITSMPIILIYIFITIMALYLICVDKVYILDQLEHHLPKKWVNKLVKHIRELTKTLGGYLKAEVFLVVISFFISLVGLYLLKFMKFKIEYPLLMALFIGFVDALPILGSGTVMIPWAIISSLDGDIIMSIIRQFLEPKFVSKNIGTHPIFTLIAMYTGFKFLGILGMLIGPIILIVVKNVFATFIDEGVFKSILDSQ